MEIEQLFKHCEKILDERGKDYGNDRRVSFEAIAGMWDLYLNLRYPKYRETGFSMDMLTSKDVAMMMLLLKVCREAAGHKTDNLVDAINYAAIAEELSN